MREVLRLFRAVLSKELYLLIQYPLNTLGGIVFQYVFFLGILFGGRTVGGDRFDDSLGAIVVGYFLVVLCINAYVSLAGNFTREASWGTLEQLYMSPLGFGRVTVIMACSNLVVSFIWGTLILGLMLLTLNRPISIDVVSAFPIAALAIMSVLGVGLTLGGFAVRYKRIGNVVNLLQFVFFGLVAAPVQQYPAMKFLPVAQGSHLLRRMTEQGTPLWGLPSGELAILLVVGVGYFLVGLKIFELMTGLARRQGVMGHY